MPDVSKHPKSGKPRLRRRFFRGRSAVATVGLGSGEGVPGVSTVEETAPTAAGVVGTGGADAGPMAGGGSARDEPGGSVGVAALLGSAGSVAPRAGGRMPANGSSNIGSSAAASNAVRFPGSRNVSRARWTIAAAARQRSGGVSVCFAFRFATASAAAFISDASSAGARRPNTS